MNPSNVITPRELKQIISSTNKPEVVVSWHGKKITVKTFITFKEMNDLVNRIMVLCTTKDKVLIPEMVSFAFRSEIISTYSSLSLPETIEERYESVLCGDLYSIIMEGINIDQLNSIKQIIKYYTTIEL